MGKLIPLMCPKKGKKFHDKPHEIQFQLMLNRLHIIGVNGESIARLLVDHAIDLTKRNSSAILTVIGGKDYE